MTNFQRKMFLLSVSENILALVCGLGILQGILLAALIYFHPKSDHSVNGYLAFYILCTSLVMTVPFAIKLIGWQHNYYIMSIPFLPGPVLYLYLRSFKEKITWKKAFPHFIVFVVYTGLTYWNMKVHGAKYPNAKDVPPEVLTAPGTLFLTISKPVQQIIYYFLSRKALQSYQRSIQQLFSETSRIDLHWAKFLVNGFLLLIVTFLVIFPVILKYPDYIHLLLLINMAVAVPYVYMATYKGITQPTIWQNKPGITKETVQVEMQQIIQTTTIDNKKSKPVLNDDKLGWLVSRITGLMENDKLYQETELTLHQMATKLEVPTYQVSQALNEGMKKNFYDLVNGYRVEEAKRLLLDTKNRNYTILSVGFEAGFNSKTTFNTVFKKFTGLTPTEFRDKELSVVEVAM